MKHEYEAKFLAVDVADLQDKLVALGAVQAFPRTLLTRKIFESDALDGSQWVRLRNEGTRTTLTLKQVTDATSIHGTTEIETEVSDLHAMAEILSSLGLREVRYQENFREEWQLGDVAFDFDTWPDLPTFLEIEGPDEASVRQAAARLGSTTSTPASAASTRSTRARRAATSSPNPPSSSPTARGARNLYVSAGRVTTRGGSRADRSVLAAQGDPRDRRVRPRWPARSGDDGRRQRVG